MLYWHAAELWLAPDPDEEEEETEKKTQKTARGSPGGAAVRKVCLQTLWHKDTIRPAVSLCHCGPPGGRAAEEAADHGGGQGRLRHPTNQKVSVLAAHCQRL